VYRLQARAGAALLRNGAQGFRPSPIGGDYFVAFPSMHVVEVLLMIWLMRKNRTLALTPIGYVIVLVPCIFMLEEHYFIDVIAAFPLAAIAIAINEASAGPVSVSEAVGTLG
jgi:hypothetical protein